MATGSKMRVVKRSVQNNYMIYEIIILVPTSDVCVPLNFQMYTLLNSISMAPYFQIHLPNVVPRTLRVSQKPGWLEIII